MFKKTLFLAAVLSTLLACNSQGEVIHSTWVGGSQGEWGQASNWNPPIVPDNGGGNTFAVTIDTGDGKVSVGLREYRTIDQLDCYGQVDLFNQTPDWVGLTLVNSNGLTNYADLEIEGEWRMEINGNLTNTAGKELELWGMMDIVGNLYNSADATIKAGGTDIGVDGDVDNSGTIIIDPETEFCAGAHFHNAHEIILCGGQCEGGELFDNAGAIKGFGFVRAENLLQNKGVIRAFGGSLAVLSEGQLTNTGTLAAGPCSTLHIMPASDTHNFGRIEVNAGGGVTFDCNLSNEPNGVIRLLGGSLAAKAITQLADANFAGFGVISGDVVIDPNAIIKFTGPTNVVGDIEINTDATLEISDGTTLVTGHCTCTEGTIHMIGGAIILQGGFTNNNCRVVWEPGLYTNVADFNLDGKVNLKDFAYFADTWLWQTAWH